MTAARHVLPGKTYMLTRRCTERMFLLGASKESAEAFGYCLAEAAGRFGVLVHAAVVMSNHVHLVLTDVRGELPRFAHLFFTQLAKATNARTGHTESVFARSSRYHRLELLSEEAIAHEIAYLLANPAKAGLVQHSKEWPGFITQVDDMASRRAYSVTTQGNPYLQRRRAKALELQIVPPPRIANLAAWLQLVSLELEQLEIQASKARRKVGAPVKGAMAVQAELWFRKPKTPTKLFELSPTLAERRKSIRIAAINSLRSFRADYRKARDSFCAGRRRVVFPPGTWAMRVVYGARVASPVPPALAA